MKAITWRKLLPVAVAIALFYLLSIVYFSPVLEGKRLVQGDLRNWQGMAQEVLEHREATGEDPLWTGSMFSGMPAYQIAVSWPQNVLHVADDLFHGFLPRPASFLFLYLLGMYILMRCLRVDPWLSIVGAVAFGFSSYFFAILEAGHNSKANAIGYAPMVLGAVFVLLRGSRLLGAALLALFMGLEISMNHVQITYYLGLVLVLFVLAEGVRAVRAKQLGDLLKRSGLGGLAIVLALACNLGMLWTTYEYGSYSTRGTSELTIQADGSSAGHVQTSGLDRDYVTQWSYGKQESLSLLVPNIKGGASGSIIQKREDFNALKDPAFRKAVMAEYEGGSYINSYWGDQSFTSGPVYIGAVIVLLMLLSFAATEGAGRWWMLCALPVMILLIAINNSIDPSQGDAARVLGMPASLLMGALVLLYLVAGLFLLRDALVYALFSALLLTLFLSWGHHLMPLTDFFLDHVPGYSKFRAVTIILVIVELAAPTLAMLYLDRLVRDGGWNRPREVRFIVPTGLLLAVLLAFAVAPGAFFAFISDAERAKYNQHIEEDPASEAAVVDFVENLKEFRQVVLSADAWRSFAFVAIAGVILFAYGRRKLPKGALIGALGVLVVVDQWPVDKRYVNNEKDRGRYLTWEDAKTNELPFKPSKADMAILQSEWSPATEAYHKQALDRMKQARAGERGSARMVGKEEELIARFGSLRRTSDYRVVTFRDPFQDSRVSYFHKSIGGYHGAKLERYQELIEFHLGPALQRVITGIRGLRSMEAVDSLIAGEGVLNMLNTRYLIYSPDEAPLVSTNGLGSAWFVDELRWMRNADEEITTLGTIDPAHTALVDERFKPALGSARIGPDPSASAILDGYATNELAYTVRSAAGGLVVFSSIWYGPDWQAYVDGQPVEHVRADYVLRAMAVPAGEHKVVFKLEGRAYRTSRPIMLAGSVLVLLLALGAVAMELRRAFRAPAGS